MAPIKISIPTSFMDSMKKFMDVVDKTQGIVNQINKAQIKIIAQPKMIPSSYPHIQVQGFMNRLPSLFHKFGSTLQRFIDRMIVFLGPKARAFLQVMVMPNYIFSGVNALTKLAGSMSAGRFAMLFRFGGVPGAVITVMKFIWDKSWALMETLQKDRVQALSMVTTVGNLRSFRAVFWMLPDDPIFEHIMATLRVNAFSDQALQIFGTLGVQRNLDTIEGMEQALLLAQARLREYPGVEIQAARELGFGISDKRIQALVGQQAISPTKLRQMALQELALRKQLGLSPQDQENIADMLSSKQILFTTIYNTFLHSIVSSGLADALITLSDNLTKWLRLFEKPSVVKKRSDLPGLKSSQSFELEKWFADINHFMQDKARIFQEQLARIPGRIKDFVDISAVAAEGPGGIAGRVRGRAYAGRRAGAGDLGPAGPSRLGPAAGAGDVQKGLGVTSGEWDAYRQGLADIESSGGRYGLTGGSSGRFSGAYQFGAQEIADTARQLGEPVPTRSQFLSDPAMQERYLSQYTLEHHRQLMRNPTYAAMSPRGKLGVLGYAHNQGVGGAIRYLQTGRAGSDAFGTSGTAYPKSIQRRLQQLDRGERPGSGLAPSGQDFTRDSNGALIHPEVLAQAEQLARSGDTQGVFRFMRSQNVQIDSNYCGDFVAAVVKAQGGRPVPGFPIATSWMNYGTPVRPGEERPGDIAILSRGHAPGRTGGHVGIVGSRGAIGRGQFQFFGANYVEEHIVSESGYVFRRPPQAPVRQPNQPTATPILPTTPETRNYTPRPKPEEPKSEPKTKPKEDPPQQPGTKGDKLTPFAMKDVKINNRSDATVQIKYNGSAGSNLADVQSASPMRRRGSPVHDPWSKQKLAAIPPTDEPDKHEEKLDSIPVNALAFTRAIGRTETDFSRKQAYSEANNQLSGKGVNANMLRFKKAGKDPYYGADYGYYQMNQEQVDDAVNRLGMSRDMAQHLTGGPHHDSTLEQQTGAVAEYLKLRWPTEYKDLIEKNDYQKMLHVTRGTWFGLANPPLGRPKMGLDEFRRIRDAARVNAAAVLGGPPQ